MEEPTNSKANPFEYRSPRRFNATTDVNSDQLKKFEESVMSNRMFVFPNLGPFIKSSLVSSTKERNGILSPIHSSASANKQFRATTGRNQSPLPTKKGDMLVKGSPLDQSRELFPSRSINDKLDAMRDTEKIYHVDAETDGDDVVDDENSMWRRPSQPLSRLPKINGKKLIASQQKKNIVAQPPPGDKVPNNQNSIKYDIHFSVMSSMNNTKGFYMLNGSPMKNNSTTYKIPSTTKSVFEGSVEDFNRVNKGVRREQSEDITSLVQKQAMDAKNKPQQSWAQAEITAENTLKQFDPLYQKHILILKRAAKRNFGLRKVLQQIAGAGEEEDEELPPGHLSNTLVISPIKMPKKIDALPRKPEKQHQPKKRKSFSEETSSKMLDNLITQKLHEEAHLSKKEIIKMKLMEQQQQQLHYHQQQVRSAQKVKVKESEDSGHVDADNEEEDAVDEKKREKNELSKTMYNKEGDNKPKDKPIHPPVANRTNVNVARPAKKPVDVVQKAGINDKDALQIRRDQNYKEFMQRMNFSFNVQVKIPTEKTFSAYKYYLGKGNNHIMIKAFMKQRWWWSQVDNKDDPNLNFMWTQTKNNVFIEALKPRRKTPFENLEASGVSSIGNGTETAASSTLAIDSGTDCESDDGEGKSRTAVSKKSLIKNGKKENVKESGNNIMKKLFTANEIMLMSSITDIKANITQEDYEELGKVKKGPAPLVYSDPSTLKMCNHLESNYHLANKKALLWNMVSYYEALKENVFDHLPLTFHVRTGFEDPEYKKFLEYFNNREAEIQEQEKALQEAAAKEALSPNNNANAGNTTTTNNGAAAQKDNKDPKKAVKKLRNIWIVKPGEDTNRGNGISVCNELSQINEIIATTEGNTDGKKRTWLIQQYLDRPFLYNKRKFDIRCYMLMTTINGTMKGYWYQDGYIRTAGKEFSLKNVTNKFIHLTNDAVQKKSEDYGKFEAGNKLSYNDFQRYLDSNYGGSINFYNDMYPKIKKLALDSIRCVYGKIDPHRRENTFEIFGLDFMFDENLKAWLIEVNTNPDINACCPVLTRVIPPMVENALRLTIDQMYPPPVWHMSKKHQLPENLMENNKFELVFDEVEDGPALRNILQVDKGATGDLILDIVAEEEEETEEENKEENKE